mmetsp:Transcript_39912/g.55488  ORF Transcript_39912/g.55488 Transcript_39912/m.55488 type:complete len:196 (+) Transcript_39912:90-677(+)|eukprot:CAMPEP_0196593968 /NCGR_PEP_ID=MMETSP1081-20130531/77040_1 /TAXON_ID=36882 /ORGANISM="Pyramimonas amylifera, Strain CCMP720" /LENGTH=195 /DNA_ID=CAMNT_0041918103 /DNA_START=86 /DNA_END=673 /DNA_ORIENTATION=+
MLRQCLLRTASSIFVQQQRCNVSQNLLNVYPTQLNAGLRAFSASGFMQRATKEFPTEFLGTPSNHDDLQKKRPMSPFLFSVDMKPHYAWPPIALSSITNRVTGCVLSIGMGGIGYVAMTGDVHATIEYLKTIPLLLPAFKFTLSFPLVYHTLGGFRHLWWDYTAKNFSNKEMEMSAYLLFGSSTAICVPLSFMTF